MKLLYDPPEIHDVVVELSKAEHELTEKYMNVLTLMKKFDYDELAQHIKEELAKKNNDRSKRIKYIEDEQSYEYRIPPQRKQGVLRMLFVVDDDYYTVVIKKVWVKKNVPKNKAN
ncbi:MAG: hypothetical protein WCT23_10460 [Candidatus Neomarinimicrobiota bacterium]|nr:hypothetical protein [Candidatus Cloacimonadota bacterium]